jgi:hypothetical protein
MDYVVKGAERHNVVVLLAAIALAVAVGVGSWTVVSGIGPGRAERLPATPIPPADDPGMGHIHGLGVNPADGHLYVATHFGLWRLEDGREPARVGTAAHDFMGFAVTGPDRFVASGHPLLLDLLDGLPPNLGLVESSDAGQTWYAVSLLGTADFHALRYAHGQLYGWDSSSQTLMVSSDHQAWDRRGDPLPILDFVVHPDDPDRLVATVGQQPESAQLVVSEDGGVTWERLEGPQAARLAWPSTQELWLVDVAGAVLISDDQGRSWTQREPLPAEPEAFHADGQRLYAVVGGALLRSSDAAASWETIFVGDHGAS